MTLHSKGLNSRKTCLQYYCRRPEALICDVQEMYLQIRLRPEDQPHHRFLWRDVQSNREPNVFEFDRVVFGVNSSPFQAQFVPQEHARQRQSVLSLAKETVLERTYMDDSLDSVPDVKTGVGLYSQLSRLSESAGMHDRRWLSNVLEVLQSISASVNLDSGELPSVKTLGVLWCPIEDVVKFQVDLPTKSTDDTKCSFRRMIATSFDHLGLLSPYIMLAKILIQEMLASGVDWDEPVDRTRS